MDDYDICKLVRIIQINRTNVTCQSIDTIEIIASIFA